MPTYLAQAGIILTVNYKTSLSTVRYEAGALSALKGFGFAQEYGVWEGALKSGKSGNVTHTLPSLLYRCFTASALNIYSWHKPGQQKRNSNHGSACGGGYSNACMGGYSNACMGGYSKKLGVTAASQFSVMQQLPSLTAATSFMGPWSGLRVRGEVYCENGWGKTQPEVPFLAAV